jgi:hypothetical protein
MTTSSSSSTKNGGKTRSTRKSAAKKPRTAHTLKPKRLNAKRTARPSTAHRTSKPASKRARTAGKSKTPATKRWSQQVNETSDALDLESGVFNKDSAGEVASSLKRSAEQSTRRKGGAFQSAMSMLTFYLNRGGKNLSEARRDVLQRAKQRLREAFHRA